MKQTKLREPILYTSLWVVSLIIVIFFCTYNPLEILGVDNIKGTITLYVFVISGIYCCAGWLLVLPKWSDRDETRDMKKYILGKIKEIDQQIADLQEEKEDLLYSDENK